MSQSSRTSLPGVSGELGRSSLRGKREASQTLTIKTKPTGAGLARTIECEAGNITVIQKARELFGGSLRDGLLKPSEKSPLSIRYGNRVLDVSEVHFAGRDEFEYLWHHPSVQTAVKSLGVPEARIVPTLRSIALDEKLNDSPSDLSECELKRLALLCALYSKSRVIALNNPFQALSPEWEAPMAKLLLSAAKDSMRVFIVTGLPKLPAPWKNNQLIKVYNRQGKQTRSFTIGTGAHDVAQAIQAIRPQTTPEEQTSLLTCPQKVEKPAVRAAVPEALQAEAIINPQLVGMFPSEQDGEPKTKLRDSSLRRKSRTNSNRHSSLTHVSKIHRLSRRFRALRWLLSLKNLFQKK